MVLHYEVNSRSLLFVDYDKRAVTSKQLTLVCYRPRIKTESHRFNYRVFSDLLRYYGDRVTEQVLMDLIVYELIKTHLMRLTSMFKLDAFLKCCCIQEPVPLVLRAIL